MRATRISNEEEDKSILIYPKRLTGRLAARDRQSGGRINPNPKGLGASVIVSFWCIVARRKEDANNWRKFVLSLAAALQ